MTINKCYESVAAVKKREVENGSFGKGIRKAPNRSVKYFQALFTYLTSVDAVDQKHEYEFH